MSRVRRIHPANAFESPHKTPISCISSQWTILMQTNSVRVGVKMSQDKHHSNRMRRMLTNPAKYILRPFMPVSLFVATHVVNAALTHEYSFNDSITSTNATDSVGGATGALYPGASYPGDGTVLLDGNSGFVYLPDDIISNYTSVSFEIWTTPTSNPTWARLFDFGTNQGGKGTGGAGGTGGNGITWFYVCLNDGVSGSFRADINPGAAMTGPQPAAGVYHHLV